MTVGERIKKRRKELGLTADYVAEQIGVDRSTIYRYESEEIDKFPTQAIEPLARILMVSEAYLMGWIDEPQPHQNNEIKEYINALFTRPELRTLFDKSSKATKEQIEQCMKIIDALNKE